MKSLPFDPVVYSLKDKNDPSTSQISPMMLTEFYCFIKLHKNLLFKKDLSRGIYSL